MSERIERWVNVHSDGSLGTFWDSPPPTLPHARVAHFVEIRDGESIATQADNGVDAAADEVRKQRDSAIERAEKAEAETLKVKRWFDSTAEELAKTSADLLAAKAALRTAESQLNDAAAKFERWAAVRFMAARLAKADAFDVEDTARVEAAALRASLVRSHYFPPAKEATKS